MVYRTCQILDPNLWCSLCFWVEVHLPHMIDSPSLFLFRTPEARGTFQWHSSIWYSRLEQITICSLNFIIKLEQYSSSQSTSRLELLAAELMSHSSEQSLLQEALTMFSDRTTCTLPAGLPETLSLASFFTHTQTGF